MYTYNITFAVDEQRTAEFTAWGAQTLVQRAASDDTRNVRLMEVMTDLRAEGVDARSYALQLQFRSLGDIDNWKEETLLPLLEECSRRFGQTVCFFETILRTVNFNPQN